MTRKVRKQIYIEPEQEQRLKQRAKELGISEAELIRRCIGRISFATEVLPNNLAAWEEAKAFIEARMSISAPQTGRSWVREELYDERFN